jgi:propanol-preferring alcohol dehydrogenase
VANFTRSDASAFLELAGRIPVRVEREVYGLSEANLALERLAQGEIRGAAVLDCR